MAEAELDNQLVRQKDKIIHMIDNGQIEEALSALSVVREMWESLRYGYKHAELMTRLKISRRLEKRPRATS
jgi:hypothetical protein